METVPGGSEARSVLGGLDSRSRVIGIEAPHLRQRPLRPMCSAGTLNETPHSGLGHRIRTFIACHRSPFDVTPADVVGSDWALQDLPPSRFSVAATHFPRLAALVQ